MASVGEIIVSSGALELTKHLVPHLKAQGGLIVNISSLQVLVHIIALHTTHIFQGRIAIPHRAAYAASKHALQVLLLALNTWKSIFFFKAWSDSLRAELASEGVSVLVISPGYVKTELSRNAITDKVNLSAD